MKMFRNLIAALVLAMPALAFGAINAPPNAGGSDLFLVVTNPTTFATEVIDLGTVGAGLASQSWTVDPNLIANLGGNAANLQYQIVGSLGTVATNATLYSTVAAGSIIANSATGFGTQLTAINNWFATNGPSFATAGSYQSFTTTSANLSWVQNASAVGAPGATLGLSGFNSVAAVGSSIDLYAITSSTVGRTTTVTQGASLGTFTLTGNTLSFVSAAAATPLPAAAWLLASGLLGFGGAARRRRVAA